jgi:hypothetical protein
MSLMNDTSATTPTLRATANPSLYLRFRRRGGVTTISQPVTQTRRTSLNWNADPAPRSAFSVSACGACDGECLRHSLSLFHLFSVGGCRVGWRCSDFESLLSRGRRVMAMQCWAGRAAGRLLRLLAVSSLSRLLSLKGRQRGRTVAPEHRVGS